MPVPWVSVSPARLHPGPISTVGAVVVPGAGVAGNQWTRIWVPSKEVTSQSLGVPGTGEDAGTTAVAERQVDAAVSRAVTGEGWYVCADGLAQPTSARASTTPSTATGAISPGRPRLSPNPSCDTGEVSHLRLSEATHPLTTCPGRPRLPPPGAVLPVGPVGPGREPASWPPEPYLGPDTDLSSRRRGAGRTLRLPRGGPRHRPLAPGPSGSARSSRWVERRARSTRRFPCRSAEARE